MPAPWTAKMTAAVSTAVLAAGTVAGTAPAAAAPIPSPPAATAPKFTRPVVAMAATPTGRGHWLVTADGAVTAYGDAALHGSTARVRLNHPIVAMAATPTGGGYWLVAADGGVFAFGDAAFHGSTGALRLNSRIVAMASTASAKGYWLVAADGGVFAFGDATFHGSTGALRLNHRIVATAPTPTGRGYWLVAADGGVFAFGDASFHGSTGAIRLNSPIVAMASTASAKGYWLVAADGGVFAFGDAPFMGSAVDAARERRVVGLLAHPGSSAYSAVASDGSVLPLVGGAPPVSPTAPVTDVVAPPEAPPGAQPIAADPSPEAVPERTALEPVAPVAPAKAPFAGRGTVGPGADIPGVHAPAALRRHEGDFVTSRDGQRIEGLHITGKLNVLHRNVVATNFKARSVSVASGSNRSASADLSWCSVGDPAGVLDGYNGIGVGNYSVRRCEVYGAVDLVKLSHGYAHLEESWLHDPVQWLSDPAQGGNPSHVDMFQTALAGDASSVVIRNNRFDAWAFRQPHQAGATFGSLEASQPATGHISLFRHATNYTIGEVLVQGNVFDGHVHRCVYAIHDAGDAPFSNARIVDNVLVRRYPTACRSQALSATTPSSIVWARNVDERGAAVTAPGTRPA